ncbi:signal-regulatory protein beta-2-like [Thunnus thynnus]|uniref:signal-regulatory protein beta-2-like n=1 Tax=Thunnus thynnus TaxID=8237 RepID=UPI00352885C7
MLIILYLLLMHRVGRCADDWIYETKTVHVGDNVRLTCTRESFGTIFWFKLVSENVPQVLARTYGSEDDPRITAIEEPGKFVLRIKKAKLSDTGVYYCVRTPKQKLIFLKGTHLKVEGPRPNTDITTVPPSDPVRPGDSVTLQCSVLSANKTCLEEHNVYWFSASLDKFNASFIYTHEKSNDRSKKSLDIQSLQKCIYNFSRNNVSSSDAGTYYCAVTTCGETLSRNGTKLNTEAVNICDLQKDNTVLFLLCAASALSLIVIVVLIYSIKKIKKKSCDCCNAAVDLHTNTAASGVQQSWQREEDSLVYSTATFTSKSCKSRTRDRKTAEEDIIYTDASALRLN